MPGEPLLACPFCRQLFPRGEATQCPDCGVDLEPMSRLPPSAEAQAQDPALDVPPELELLPWTFVGRGRGLLLLIAAAGIAVFFAPWLHETAPELRTLSGFAFARRLYWLWAAGVGWAVMLALVASRRTVYHMRGARVAVGLLAAVVLATAVLRALLVPESTVLRPVRIEWGWGLYAAGLLAAAALLAAPRFGGSLIDMPTRQRRRGDETLH
ncbi:MAG: hypothetical protein HY744_12945 [Deltaproteobacteria bacterium]|nr:hypothetical protein [Deltaproteobacteria bacterium]